jgi:hypothetical protein
MAWHRIGIDLGIFYFLSNFDKCHNSQHWLCLRWQRSADQNYLKARVRRGGKERNAGFERSDPNTWLLKKDQNKVCGNSANAN